MEWLKEQAIATAPYLYPQAMKALKRFVDDILEIIKKGETENLTQHLNQIDATGSTKFTYKEEQDGHIPL